MRNFLCLLCIIGAFFMSAKSMVKPASLQPGDKIAIISPASHPDSSYIDSAIVAIKGWGYVPVVGKNAYKCQGTFAGSTEERIEDLKWAFESKDIKAVMCSRGGYGSIQSLYHLPKGYFAKHPKWLIGYSDITDIHSAMAVDGVMSIHGHMCEYLRDYHGTDSLSGFLRKILAGDAMKYTVKSDCKYNNEGEVEGVLFGGNLTMLTSIGDTRISFLPKGKNIILFLEDVGERIESVDRMLYRLKMSGVLSRINGLIVGSFRGATATPDFESVEALFNSVVKDYNIPVVYNFPVGHVDANYPLIQGCKARLKVGAKVTTLEMK